MALSDTRATPTPFQSASRRQSPNEVSKIADFTPKTLKSTRLGLSQKAKRATIAGRP
jgi:hypothetical protein